MKIAVASGKGGTGKTTIATNLALSIGEAQLIDCDVEEPDSHLFLDVKLEEIEKVTLKVPKIDESKCDHCGECSDFCRYNAIAVVPSEVIVFPELCHGCGGCTLVCPQDAITETERTIGIIEGGITNGLEFLHGILNVGEPMATPVIKALKRKMKDDQIVILDSPPGTACPVIETVKDTDFCILVTEPTPFGLHDLKLAVDVVTSLLIPFGVIINRDGVGDDRVERYCKDNNIEVLMKVPQDRDIAKLYSKGVPFVSEMEEWKKRFSDMLSHLEEIV